jgi:hypothetical protein
LKRFVDPLVRPTPKERKRKDRTCEVGDLVQIQIAGSVWTVKVIEDRGYIGHGGRRIVRVTSLPECPDDPCSDFEIPENQVLRIVYPDP